MGKNNTRENNLVVGLDIGTTKIATIVGYRNENGQIDIIGHGVSDSTGVEFGEIKNINHTVEGIIGSINLASQQSQHDIIDVYVGIAGHHIKTSRYNYHFYRYDNNSEITKEEIDNAKAEVFKVVVPPGERIIDVIPQRYLIDNKRETFEPVGELGNEIIATYQIITGKDQEINRIILCGDRSNIKFNEIILEPIASGLSCLSEEEKRQGCVLVDIGGGTTDMIIYKDGSPVYTKVVSIGGDIITKDIAKVCKISEEVAEQLKIKYGTCIVDKSNENNLITIPRGNGLEPIQINENYLAQIINSRVQEEILYAIKKEIEQSGYKDSLYAGLVLTGGGAKLRHIKELCQFMLQLNTRIGIPENGFSRTISTDLKHPKFATALGLLKYGIEAEENIEMEEYEEEDTNRFTNIFNRNKNNGENKDSKKEKNEEKKNWGFFTKVRDFLQETLDKVS